MSDLEVFRGLSPEVAQRAKDRCACDRCRPWTGRRPHCRYWGLRRADERAVEAYPAAAWMRWSGDYSFLGGPIWGAYSEELELLGEYQPGGRPASVIS